MCIYTTIYIYLLFIKHVQICIIQFIHAKRGSSSVACLHGEHIDVELLGEANERLRPRALLQLTGINDAALGSSPLVEGFSLRGRRRGSTCSAAPRRCLRGWPRASP